MRWFLRSFVFAAALFLGFAAASVRLSGGLSDCVFDLRLDSEVVYDQPTAASMPKGISVMYAGFDHDPSYIQPFLKFVIYNGLVKRISYDANTPYSPYAELYANRRRLPAVMGDGDVTQEFYILPGGSAEVRVYSNQFAKRPRKDERIVIGFYLDGNNKAYNSQPFLLPDQFRKAIDP